MKIYAAIVSILLILAIYYNSRISEKLHYSVENAKLAESMAYDDCKIMLINQKLISEINGCIKGVELICQKSHECVLNLAPICEKVIEY